MRIVHVTDRRFPPSADEGGAPQSLLSLYEEQRRQGHGVWVATTGASDSAGIWNLSGSDSHVLSLVAKIRDYAVDVVHFHAHAAAMQAEVHAAGIASVTHVHGNHPGRTLTEVNPIYVSRRHAEIHRGEVYVHNGIDVSDVAFESRAQNYLGFLGKVRRSKKGADLAMAVAQRTRRQLMLVGGRKFSIPQTWLPFQRWVRPLGVLAGEEKLAVLRNASALLFPIRWEEPFGLVLIEAMACGTPVIAFDRGAVREIVRDGVTGFIVSDVNEMCEAIERIPEIDRAACRRHVVENFSIERTADGVMECYRRAIAGERW